MNYLAQTPYDCGVYNIHTLLKDVLGKDIHPETIKSELGIKWFGRGFLPMNVVAYLKKQGTQVERLPYSFDVQARLNTLEHALHQGKKILLLVHNGIGQHYVSALGTRAGQFYMYDPKDPNFQYYTPDSNGDALGNKTWSADELIAFWDGGGMVGWFTWWGLAVSAPLQNV